MLIQQSEFTPGVSEFGILSRVRCFVNDTSVCRERGPIRSDEDRIFEKSALDSKYLLAMINFIEDECGIHVASCEITEENFGSLRAVARFVASKQPFAVG